jgi:pimeloyl-ACP methyl ester carboxylesterase
MKRTAATVAALYVAALVGLAVFQRSLQYHPNAAIVPPAQAGLAEIETLALHSDDGETLYAWFKPPRDGKPLLLYFHGNGGLLADRQERFHRFVESGYGLLAVAYRGFGGSTGEPTEAGLRRDAEAAWREAARRGYTDRRLVIVGESLGTGVATMLATRHSAAALVLDAPFLSAVSVAEGRYPIFPVDLVMQDTFRSDLAIAEIHMPVLMLHGEDDPIIPIASARELFERAQEPKQFIAVPGAKHLVLNLQPVYPRVAAFIDAATATAPTVQRVTPP